MNIELKNVKEYKNMSQETTAFHATLYVDGKRVGTASNGGYGDPIHINAPRKVVDQMVDYANSLPEVEAKLGDYSFRYKPSPDSLISDILTKNLQTRDLKRDLKNRILFVEDGKLMRTNIINRLSDVLQSRKAEFERSYGNQILNYMSFDDAFNIYLKS